MKYCRKCGAELYDDAQFCSSCGEKVEVKNEIVKSEEVEVVYNDVRERSIVTAIILTILTCGLYSIYWMIKVNDDALKVANEKGTGGVEVVLFTILTCGIYGFFWAYKMGSCTDKIKGSNNGVLGVLYIILHFFGLSIVYMALTQYEINNKVRRF